MIIFNYKINIRKNVLGPETGIILMLKNSSHSILCISMHKKKTMLYVFIFTSLGKELTLDLAS